MECPLSELVVAMLLTRYDTMKQESPFFRTVSRSKWIKDFYFSYGRLTHIMFVIKKLFVLIMLPLFLLACADTDAIRTETKGWSVQKLYTEANKTLSDKNYSRSIKLYNVLEATYPYGVYAQQGLLDLAYAYYQNDQPELALPTLDQFIRTYPANANIDYALYLKGYINYKNDNGLLSKYSRQDISERDPKGIEEAYKAFYELATKYPNSRYAPDAKDKVQQLVNALARGEIYRARYYMSINAYLAGINRAQNVINTYPNTQYVEEALAIMVSAYSALNQVQLSNDTLAVLKLNFPNSGYLAKPWVYFDIPWYAFWQN